MKKYAKFAIIPIVIIAIIVVIILMNGNPSYVDTINSKELLSNAVASFETDGGYNVLDDDVILMFSDDDLPYLRDYSVIKSKATKNINEIGVFRVEDGKAEDMKAIVQKYLAAKQENYRNMDYFPEEIEKIDFATVKVFGNYVAYSFLNESDTEAFYNSIEKQIKE